MNAAIQIYNTWFDSATNLFANLLASINLRPDHYATLFPHVVTLDHINELAQSGKFPLLPDLAPAFTYAIIMSVIRLCLQSFLMKVTD
jgi:hypothetical protein